MEKSMQDESRFRKFIDRITDGFIALDKNFCYTYVNSKVGEMVHRNPDSLLGKNVWDEFPDAVGSTTYKAFHTAMNEQRFISNIDFYAPLNLWQENYIYPSPEGLSVFIKDISDRKKLELELRERERNQQFEIMITALEAQEKERTLIGQELHDNVNQLLVATKLILSLLRDDPTKVSPLMFDSCIDNLKRAIDENRKLSHELVTPDLKDQSLKEQLENLFQSMLIDNGIDVTIDITGCNEELLDNARKLSLYRIAQEQCTNIIKHAHATKVDISLDSTDGIFTMTITDNGVGKDVHNVPGGIGLKNMEGRVKIFDGSIRVISSPYQGFSLEVYMPVGHEVQGVGNWE